MKKKFKALPVSYNSVLFFNWFSYREQDAEPSTLVIKYIVGCGRMQLNGALSRRNVVFIGGRSVSLNSNADSNRESERKRGGEKRGGDGEGGLADI